MKKLKLNQSNFAGAEVLTRAQLKKVMGGDGSGMETGSGTDYCEGRTRLDCLVEYSNFESSGDADADAIMMSIILDECDKCPRTSPEY